MTYALCPNDRCENHDGDGCTLECVEVRPMHGTMRVVLDDGAYMPERAHPTDAGLDIRTPENFEIKGGDSYIVDTGVHVELPPGTCGMLVSKSGLNVRHGITSTGLIDEGYQGSVKVRLHNDSPINHVFKAGNKVTQLVVIPCEYVRCVQVESFGVATDRGDGGFGSTGR